MSVSALAALIRRDAATGSLLDRAAKAAAATYYYKKLVSFGVVTKLAKFSNWLLSGIANLQR